MKTIFTSAILAVTVNCGHAASTQIIASNLGSPIFDNTGTPLSVGVDTLNGDGDLFEIGYFSDDTASFQGTWISITGVNSNNTAVITTIGDLDGQDGSTSVPDGQFSTVVEFNDARANTANDLPAAGAQLALRFYDDSTPSSATYNTVTSTAWQFKALSATASPPFPNLDLSDQQVSLVWEDNTNPFRTTLVVPEPSSALLASFGGLAILLRRRRS